MILTKVQFLYDRMRHSFDAKPFEWFFGLSTLAWGIGLGNTIETFKLSSSYRVFANLMTEDSWAIICFWGGLMRLVVLTINGSWFRSALLRTLASFSTLALWLASTIAFGLSGTGTPGALIYALYFMVEFRVMLNAAVEAGRSERAEWARLMAADAVQRYGRLALILLFATGLTRGAKRNGAGHPI